MDVVADLPADPQPPEPVQQRDGLLHHVPVLAQPRAVRDAAAGDDRADALGRHQGAVLVVVVGAVGEHLDRPPPGPATAAATGGIASINGSSWVTSLRFPPVKVTAEGTPLPSVIT